MISLPPSPGYASFISEADLIDCARRDLEALEQGGADGVLVENDFDQPHTLQVTAEIERALSRVTAEVVRSARVPVGVQVLLNDWRASLAIAASTGARFIRSDFFVDRVRTRYGVIEPQADALMRERAALGVEHIHVYADLQVKYSTLVDGPKPIADSAREAALAGADAVIVTGAETGIGPTTTDLRDARAAQLPVLIGSGLSAANAAQLARCADGFIVGTSLRSGPTSRDRVQRERVVALVRALRPS